MDMTNTAFPGLVAVPTPDGKATFQIAPSAIQDPELRNQIMLRQMTQPPVQQTGLPDQPAEPAAMLSPAASPSTQTTVRKTTTDIPGAQKLISQMQTGMKEHAEAQVKALQVDKDTIEQQVKANQAKNDLREKFLMDEENAARVKNEALEKVSQNIQGIRNEMKAAQIDPNRLFKGNTGAQIGAAIAAGIGAYAAAFTGGPNNALNIIQSAIDRDIDAQKSALQKKTAEYQIALDEENMVKSRFADATSQRKAQYLLRLEAVDQKLSDLEMSAKSTNIQNNIAAMRGQLKTEAAKLAYDLAARSAGETITETVLGGGRAAALTNDQSNAAIFGERMIQAEADMGKLQQAGYNRANLGEAVVSSIFPGPIRPEATKMQDQAELNFLTAVLRKESGAAISDSEMKNGEAQYFPRAGDTEAVINQKKMNREIAIKGMMRAAGPAAATMQTPTQSLFPYAQQR